MAVLAVCAWLRLVLLSFSLVGISSSFLNGNADSATSGSVKSFLNDRYTTTTDPGNAALIALDVRDMISSPGAEAQAIYENGKNALLGQSLQALALNFPSEMANEPYYQFFVYAAKRDEAIKSEALTYADSIITHLFDELLTTKDDPSDDAMANDAVVAILFWMQHVHHLFQALEACELGNDGDVPKYLDMGFAMYVGEGQQNGSDEIGYSLYNLAEKMAPLYNTENTKTGEAYVNQHIVMLYTGLQKNFVLNDQNTCADDPINVPKQFRAHILAIIHKTTVPLVQSLLHYLQINKPLYAEIHALQLIPLLGMCSRKHADTLQELMVSREYDPKTFANVLETLQASYDCLGITCADVGAYETNAIPACQDKTTANLAGFITSVDVSKPSKIDRDVFQVGILLSQNAITPARNIFTKGMNSMVKDTVLASTHFSQTSGSSPNVYQSLRDLAEDDGRIASVPFYKNFQEYFDDADYGYDLVTRAISRQEPYSQNTPIDQVTDGVLEALVAVVTHHAALQHFYTAHQKCTSSPDDEQSIFTEWDTGVAYLIGSMEGSGNSTEGQLMYALAKSTCSSFGSCQQLTEAIFAALRNGPTESYYIGSCLSIQQAAETVTGVLQAVLIQATLESALDNEKKSKKSARGYVLATALLPILEALDPAAATIIDQNMRYSDSPGGSNSDDVWSAFASLIPKMSNVTCSLIGSVPGKPNLCSANSSEQQQIDSSQAVNLAGYVPKTDVTYILSWSLDVKDMLSASTPKDAKNIFLQGTNAERPLANLSTTTDQKMFNEPIFNIYRYSLAQIGPLTEGKENGVSEFAKSIVMEIFNELGNETDSYYGGNDMAVEAVQLNILFMEVIHGLYAAALQCSIGRGDVVIEALDGAVAFYVGVDQTIGDSSTGYSVYKLADKIGALFGTMNGTTSLVNTYIMKEFISLQTFYMANNPCAQDPISATSALMTRINGIVDKMKVVVIQSLIHYLYLEKLYYAELYAFHVTPLVALCDYALSEELEAMLINSTNYDSSMFNDIVGDLQSVYSCMGISCSDVGSYQEQAMPACTTSFNASVQPYKDVIRVNRLISDRYMTLTDQTNFANILDDIRDVVNAPNVAVSKDIFERGKNAYDANGTVLTLASLSKNAAARMGGNKYFDAIQSTLGLVPALSNNNSMAPDFAYKIISDVFSELSDTYGDTSDDAMAGEALILGLISVEIWHYLEIAVHQCNTSAATVDQVAVAVDRAAMLYVGLNQTYGSSQTGYSFYRLAEYVSNYFGTYASDGESSVNSAVLLAFDEIKRTFLLSDYCLQNPLTASIQLQAATEVIINKMKVVMIQGLLMYMAAGEYNYAELYTLLVAPITSLCDKSVSYSLLDKLITNKAIFEPSMINSLVSEIQGTYRCLNITCEDVGAYSDATGTVVVPQCGTGPANASELKPYSFAGYTPTTNVTYILNLYADVKEINDASSTETARTIFLHGANASEKPLANYSTMAGSEMVNEPIFNMYRYSLAQIGPLAGGKENKVIDEFAKTTIIDVLDETVDYYGESSSNQMAAEAVKLNILFMEVVHGLFAAASHCSQGDTVALAEALDGAVAFYVGPSQQVGDDTSGFSIYNDAERMGTLFGTVSVANISLVNDFVMSEFIQLQNDYVKNSLCEQQPASASKSFVLRANRIVDKMKAVSMQGLIHNLYQEKKLYSELYALHVIPMVAMCDYAFSEVLEQKLVVDQQNYTSSMFNGIVSKLQEVYSCMGMGCSDVGIYTLAKNGLQSSSCNPSIITSPQPFTDVIQVNRLISDRYMTLTDQSNFAKILDDIQDVVNAPTVDVAKDIFFNGKNAISVNGANVTLASLSSTAASRMGNNRYFNAFQTTLGTLSVLQSDNKNQVPDYAKQIISDVFSELVGTYYDDQGDNALAAEALILTLVSMEIWHYLDEAVLNCANTSSTSVEDVALSIDRAAMLYIGMSQTYGSSTTGYSFYRLAEFVSNDFGTRSDDSESAVNSGVILAFDNIKRTFLLSDYCLKDPVTASRQLQVETESVIDKMIVVMVQGLLKYMASGNYNYAELYALQIAPLASLCNNSISADLIEKLVTKKSSFNSSIMKSVVSEIQGLYECWGITCSDVGSYKNGSGAILVPQCESSGPFCLTGYCPSSPIDSSLGYMIDLRDIANAQTAEIAKEIFVSGNNSSGGKSLSSLSSSAKLVMANEPFYNIFKYSLVNVAPLANSANGISDFGESIITSVFDDLHDYYDDQISKNMAVEAIVLHIIFMQVAHNLFAAAAFCEKGSNDMVAQYLDAAVVFYVGVDQQTGDSNSGYSWYNLAERMATQFGTTNEMGSSIVNEFVIGKMNDLQKLYVNSNNTCSQNPHGSSAALLQAAQEIINKMKVVSLQSLIYYMYIDDKYFVELYALHLTPFVSICEFSLSEDLEEKLITSVNDLETSVFDDIIRKLQNVYSCMGISCSDVGALSSSPNAACTFAFDTTAQPFVDVIRVNSFITDRYTTLTDQTDFGGILDDIRDVVSATSLEDAKAVFFSGKNAKEKNGAVFTLASLSTTAAARMGNERYFGAFQTTLGSVPALTNGNAMAPDYGYKIVSKIFTELARTLGDTSDDAMAGEALILTIISMEIWHYLHSAVLQCRNAAATTVEDVAFAIDRAAMLYIGTNQTHGSESGFSFYRLAEYVSKYFGTFDADGESSVNSNVLATFESIKRNFLMSNACIQKPITASRQLQLATEVIIDKMKAVMVQGLLMYMSTGNQPFAELYALQVSPLSSLCNEGVSQDLLAKFALNDGQQYDQSMLTSIVSEIQSVYECLGITCQDVGAFVANDEVLVPKCTDAKAVPYHSLAGYTPTTDVEYLLNTTLDVAAIRKMSNWTEAKVIYEQGMNSFDPDGVSVALADWSQYADWDMSTLPYFNFFKYALARIGALSNGHDLPQYSGTIVQDIFLELGSTLGDKSDDEMAAEAIVITHYWMQVARRLYESISGCAAKNSTMASIAIDLSVAAYVGLDQKVGDDKSGYVLYNLAEKMSLLFSTETQNNGTSQVNQNIMKSFEDIQQLATTCLNNTSAASTIHLLANKIIQQMTVPLVQGLLFYMDQSNAAEVELYGLQITPLVATCSESKYVDLQDLLVLSESGYTDDMRKRVTDILESSYPCMGITCDDIGRYGNYSCNAGLTGDNAPITRTVGFDLSNNIDGYLKIDLDVRQISMLMSVGAYTAAEDMISRGQNALVLDSSGQPAYYRSIKNIAKPELVNFILNVTNQDKPFEKISPEQITALVVEAIQTMFSYQASIEMLNAAVEQCTSNDANESQISLWESALGYLVGYIEGADPGGNFKGDGQMMYALAKENCFQFNICTDDGDSKLNEELLFLFRQGKENLASNACSNLPVTVQRIVSVLQTILIQGTLKFALAGADLTGDSGSKDLARGYVLAQSIYPILELADSQSAAVIETNMAFPVPNNPVPDGIEAVFTAIATAIPHMTGIDCTKIGNVTYGGFVAGVCPVNDGNASAADPQDLAIAVDSVVDQETPLAISNGLYTSNSNVQDRIDIAADVWDISKALSSQNVNLARSIYREGLNSEIRDNQGFLLMRKRNIADFSLMAGQTMTEDLPFNLFRYALQDAYGYYKGAPVEQYADTFVEHAFENTLVPTLAVEAIVALNIWMAVVHELYEQINQCKAFDESNAPLSVDIAAAYYIGDGQQTGSSQTGHLLYRLTEEAGELFGQDGIGSGEAEVNTKVLILFNRIKGDVSSPDSCPAKSSTVADLRLHIDQAVSYMTVPLLQNLIHYMKTNDRYRVQLYALSVIPLIAGCNEATFSYLRTALIDNDYDPLKFNEILEKLQGAYRCLGVSCADVGAYKGGMVPQCQDPSDRNVVALAGYLPTTNVFDQSEIDLDILQIKILVSMGALSAANDLYNYGRNSMRPSKSTSNGLLSLQSIASDPTIASAPSLKTFLDYYQISNFADSVVTNVFTSSEQYKDLTLKQKATFVSTTLNVMVMYMFSLSLLDTAVMDCNAADIHRNEFGITGIDFAAASIIGSIEGHKDGGNPDDVGLLLYGLSKKNCDSMHTCTVNGDSEINDRLGLLLYAAQSELNSLSCVSLSHTVTEIQTVLKTILLQSLIRSIALLGRADESNGGAANIQEMNAEVSDDDTDFINAYLYTLALVPLINKANPQSSFLLEVNMAFENLFKPLDNLKWQVFYAIADAIKDMPDVDCNLLGYISDMDPCSTDRSHLTTVVAKATGQSSGAPFISFSQVWFLLLATFMLAVLW